MWTRSRIDETNVEKGERTLDSEVSTFATRPKSEMVCWSRLSVFELFLEF